MKRLLIVDDEILMVQSIIDRIQDDQLSLEVVNKKTGSDGIRIIEQERFDIVILDMMLPLGNDISLPKEEPDLMYGIYILRKIREKKPSLPVICYTVVNDHDVRRQIEAIPNSYFFSKLTINSFDELFCSLSKFAK